MLTDGLSLAALIQQAPVLAISVVALVVGLWGIRAARRADVALEARLGGSNIRQGERLGDVEHALGLLDMRRLITEEELAERGIRLSYWPPDGRRGYSRRDDDDRDDRDDEDQAADDDRPGHTEFAPATPPVPPLPDFPRHRRSAS